MLIQDLNFIEQIDNLDSIQGGNAETSKTTTITYEKTTIETNGEVITSEKGVFKSEDGEIIYFEDLEDFNDLLLSAFDFK